MRVTCLQLDVIPGSPDRNFAKAEGMIARAMAQQPDVLVLPETWNTGFFPKAHPEAVGDRDCSRVRSQIGSLAKRYGVNIVAGSVTDARDGKIYNTACVFDRQGALVARYDKTHLFSPAGEDQTYTKGEQICTFSLDGIRCGIIICYDLRFPELTRAVCLSGAEVLFVVSQWPKVRLHQYHTLAAARAIENQMFVVCCNACDNVGGQISGGGSVVVNPLGERLALAADAEEIITADCGTQVLRKIRSSIPVFRDRRPELYRYETKEEIL